MYAVVRFYGFQYLVQEGEKVSVPRLASEAGAKVTLDDVLLLRPTRMSWSGRPGSRVQQSRQRWSSTPGIQR